MLEHLTNRPLCFCLQIMSEMLVLNKEPIYSLFYHCVSFPERLMGLLKWEEAGVRGKAANIISYFAFQDKSDIIDDLFNRKVVDCLWEGQCRFPPSSDYTKNMLITISNLADSEEHSEVIAAHPICPFIVAQHTAADSADVQKEALYCLHTLLAKARYSTMERIVASFDILRVLAQGLLEETWDVKVM
jgi:hypothetical protein